MVCSNIFQHRVTGLDCKAAIDGRRIATVGSAAATTPTIAHACKVSRGLSVQQYMDSWDA
jgi:hypothetical protein